MSEEPKPKTYAWTAETVDGLLDVAWDEHAWGAIKRGRNSIAVADAHNASLDELRIASNAALEQLAAEREGRDGIENRLGVAFDRMVADYQKQLAAEREKVQHTKSYHQSLERTIQQLREQRDEAIRLLEYKEKQLAIRDRAIERRDIANREHVEINRKLRSQLAASQAAMKEAIEQPYHVDAYRILEEALNGDTDALDAAIAEAQKPLLHLIAEVEEHNIRGAIHPDVLAKHIASAQKPLVDALTFIRDDAHPFCKYQKVAEDALAKVKEGKWRDEPAIKVSGDYGVTISNGYIKKDGNS